jgi:hypothetical protein
MIFVVLFNNAVNCQDCVVSECFMECDAALFGDFVWHVVPDFLKAPWPFEMSGTVHPMMQCCISACILCDKIV